MNNKPTRGTAIVNREVNDNTFIFSGKVTDQYNKPIEGAKVIVVTKTGIPIPAPSTSGEVGEVFGSISDENGKWSITVPEVVLCSDCNTHIMSRVNGLPDEIRPLSKQDLEFDFIYNAKTQQEQEVIATGCKSFKCKVAKSYSENKKAYIWGIVALVLIALTLGLIFSKKRVAI